jgi:hypothetical protein
VIFKKYTYLTLIFCLLTSRITASELKTVSYLTNLAQATVWLDEEKLAVGRFDGTITIFSYNETPLISQALVSPSKQAITMVEKIDDSTFISSNGASSIALWEQGFEGYFLKETYAFQEYFGSVDSAKFLKIGNKEILLTGHSEGHFLFWEFSNGQLSISSSMDLKSTHRVDSPYALWNIRSIALWQDQFVITASEDGDLCMIDILKGTIIYRQKYNKNAKRGINHISVFKDYLLLANCPVGALDKNLWLYHIEKDCFTYLDSKKLIKSKDLEQVYSFDVALIPHENATYFLCSTQEGLLWLGEIKNRSLHLLNSTKVSPQGGALLAAHPSKNSIAAVSYDMQLLEVCAD